MIDGPVIDKSVTPVTESPIAETQSPPVSTPEPEVEMNTSEEAVSIPNTPCAASTPAVQVIHKCDPRPFDSGLGQSDMDSEMSNLDNDPVKQKLFDLSQNDSSYNLRPRNKEWFIARLISHLRPNWQWLLIIC